MRFRKSIRLAPGVRINLSGSGMSTTFGGRGGSVNVGKRGTRATVGIPGTGLSYSQRVSGAGGGGSNGGAAQAGGYASVGCLGFFMLVLVVMCTGPDTPSSAPGLAIPPPYSAPVTTETREWFYVHGALNVRTAPDKGAARVRTLRRGDYVQLGPKDATGWARLYSLGSSEGYVYRASDLVRRQAPVAPTPRRAASSGGGSRRSSGGRVYHTGPRGGCYYYNGSGNKQYVDHSYCY
jgi:hypothetical protein